ncbi:thioredoxin domain-containing protein [Chloracidobacterium sp. MS 40/45]|uniref:thioredoxin domain-containing protein n=1 Tax=Chloracidobacterium aggregatum TaxID=2851959 RepID=UPI001B8D37B9|nr:thioredoxin domain-containing protein [Chloracidobacterium aggregatum]QUW00564.1 thioredoxin domain-containing protein [Chloracidobacterium sp. MS 40/45]
MSAQPSPQFVNRLISETSPYLLQHAHNPVDWYPWGPEALARAKAEDKPILLSIGYSACHWCHVMEHECFENPSIADLMNELFINIKVDREERPDLDTVYMNAVQLMTGRGGWPLTMFLTPDGEPFYGGTYFPPEDRGRMPGFPRILRSVADAYRQRRQEVRQSIAEITAELQRMHTPLDGARTLSPEILTDAYRRMSTRFDHVHGGFGGAPKFPNSMLLSFLLRYWRLTGELHALEMVELSLDKMAGGGMYDHLGGGFHRYSTDDQWLVPHFEKMLYDNALLARTYLEAWQATGKPRYRQIVEETLDYVMREMTAPTGGFYATQDADSEGEEGRFFVWTPEEIHALLDEADADLVCHYFDVTREGNFEGKGKTVLSTPLPPETVARLREVTPEHLETVLARARRILFEARERRVKPARDEKCLAAWNGLMLYSFARAAAVLERDDYRAVAERNAAFVLGTMYVDGILYRSHKDGQNRFPGYQEDYACYAEGLLALYEATGNVKYFCAARELTEAMLAQFDDPQGGGFFFTGDRHEQLITRVKDVFDNATPSGNSVAVDVLLRLALLTAEQRYGERAEHILQTLSGSMAKMPSGFGQLLGALDFYLASVREIVIVGPPAAAETRDLRRVVEEAFRPHRVVALLNPEDGDHAQHVPLVAQRVMQNGQPTAYVCRNFACQAPATTPDALRAQLA